MLTGCKAGLWGVNCTKSCLPCANGGVCHDGTGECICPPGFKGPTCQTGNTHILRQYTQSGPIYYKGHIYFYNLRDLSMNMTLF